MEGQVVFQISLIWHIW